VDPAHRELGGEAHFDRPSADDLSGSPISRRAETICGSAGLHDTTTTTRPPRGKLIQSTEELETPKNRGDDPNDWGDVALFSAHPSDPPGTPVGIPLALRSRADAVPVERGRVMRAAHRVLLTLTAVMCFGSLERAFAQGSNPRFEVGGQLGALRLSDFAATSVGLGGRLSYDLSRWITIEGEYSVFPHDDIAIVSSGTPSGPAIAYQRRRSEGFVGPKMGIRGERVGVFAKVRPGLSRLSHKGVLCTGEVCALMLLAVPGYRTEFALDAGGVLEFYPSARTDLRLDLGTTLVRHRSSAPPCWGDGCTSSNFTSSLGFGVRF
jgi:hypothetical protein